MFTRLPLSDLAKLKSMGSQVIRREFNQGTMELTLWMTPLDSEMQITPELINKMPPKVIDQSLPEIVSKPDITPAQRQRPACLQPKKEELSPLTERLSLLRSMAWQHPGKPARITLTNGLRLDLVAEPGGTYRLLLARQTATPSDTELATVLNHWPDPIPDVGPEAFDFQGWHCIKVVW